MSSLVRLIIDLNIKHYRDLLKTQIDPVKRRTVVQLLAEEEVRLAATFNLPAEGEERGLADFLAPKGMPHPKGPPGRASEDCQYGPSSFCERF